MQKLIILMSLFLFLITGCEATNSQNNADSGSDKISESMYEKENHFSVNCDFHEAVPVGKDRILLPSDVVSYSDLTTNGEPYVFCTKAGCAHDSDDCPAYIGDALMFAEYQGIWFYTSEPDEGRFMLVRHDPSSNQRKILLELHTTESESIETVYRPGSFMISNDRLYIQINVDEYNHADSTINSTEIWRMITLSDTKTEDIATYNPAEVSYFMLASDHNEAVFEKVFIDGKTQLVTVDIAEKKETIVADFDSGIQIQSDACGNSSGEKVIYITDNEIHLFNMTNGSDELVVTMDDSKLIRAQIYGDTIYYVYEGQNENLQYASCDINGKNQKEYISSFEDSALKFGKYQATANGFLGRDSHGEYGWISKTDCDNEKYTEIRYLK